MVTDHKRPNPKDVRFYVRPKTMTKSNLPTIKIRLKDVTLRKTVLTILKGSSCFYPMFPLLRVAGAELPTDYVDNIEAEGDNDNPPAWPGDEVPRYHEDEFHVSHRSYFFGGKLWKSRRFVWNNCPHVGSHNFKELCEEIS